MNLTFDFDDSAPLTAKMNLVGVGGAGGNAINRMIHEGLRGVNFIAVNTDEQALEICQAPIKVRVGTKTTKGLGAGADPEKGRRAIEEDRNAIYESLAESDMVFVTAGMGGGTGTGAAPIVAEVARDIGALTVGIVTKPFLFEGPKRSQRAEEGINQLKENVDTLIVIPNQRLLSIVPEDTPLDAAFRYADEILFSATKGISDLISVPGLVNLDFADVRAIMSEMGDALMGSGCAQGDNRAKIAAEQAIHSPLLENVSISGAMGVLVNITGGPDLTLHEVNAATSIIFEEAGQNANIIFGAVIDKELLEEIRITVIATGFTAQRGRRHLPGLNRTNFDFGHTSSVPRREIPAIDRVDEINDDITRKTNSHLYVPGGRTPEKRIKTEKDNEQKDRSVIHRENREKHREERKISLRDADERKRQEPTIFLRDSKINKDKQEDGGTDQDRDNDRDRSDEKKSYRHSKRSNGYSDEDYEIPTIRRRRWNLL